MTEKYFDIWVMREYGVVDSWTKQLVVGPLLRIHRPLPLAKNGELLLLGDHYTHNALLKYNIGSQEIKILQPTSFKVIHPNKKLWFMWRALFHSQGEMCFRVIYPELLIICRP